MHPKKIELSKNWKVKYYFAFHEGQNSGLKAKELKGLNLPEFWFDLPPLSKVVYQNRFILQNEYRYLQLYFDRLECTAEIKINNNKIYQHSGNRDNFSIDIKHHINIGSENLLTIITKPDGLDGRVMGRISLLESDEKIEPPINYHKQKAIKPPKWLDDCIIYELYIRAFDQDGDFQAVIQKLDYLQELGINCIWLMPIFPIGLKRRKGSQGSPYAIKDFKEINPKYGSAQDFRKLVDKAHSRGVKVILDIACNHTAWDNELIEKKPDWFSQDENGEIVQPGNTDWSDVADLDYNNSEVREYMLEVLLYWVEEFDIDGFRMDVAEFVPLDFWEKVFKEMKKIKPQPLMLAEGDHPQLHASAFHLSYGWNTRLSLLRILNYNQSAKAFQKVVEHEQKVYPKNTLKMRFTENHDLERSRKIFGKGESKLAALLCFTIPGVPMVYTGQELGASHKPSLFEKDPVDWSQVDRELLKFYKTLIEVRKQNQLLAKGKIRFLENSQENVAISFFRDDESDQLLIVANTLDYGLDIDIYTKNLIKVHQLDRILGNSVIYQIQDGKITMQIPVYGFGVYQIND
ncbi:MAG: hypothetical protein K9M80_00750 [Candidatus Marinimicrobia bacterium]|nr:hypothetical protein [Candidatus Neomarinimicrobiota bacterium]